MNRRFRANHGGLALDNKGKLAKATTSNATTSTTQPPTRRAKLKPKVGIVASVQRSIGKTSKESEVSVQTTRDGGQLSVNTKTTVAPVNIAGGNKPSINITKTGTSSVDNPVGSQPLRKTGIGVSAVSTDDCSQPSTTSQKSTVHRISTSPVNKDGGSRASAGVNPAILAVPLYKNGKKQTSSGSTLATVSESASDGTSTGTNSHSVTSSTGSSLSAGRTTNTAVSKRTTSKQNRVIPNTTAPVQGSRRERIKPRVGIVSSQPSVQNSRSLNQVNSLPKPPSMTVSCDKTDVSMNTSSKETYGVSNAVTTKLPDPSSTNNTVALLNKTNVQEKGPDTLEQTPVTRRHCITPKVGKDSRKINRAPVGKTNPVSQGNVNEHTSFKKDIESNVDIPSSEKDSSAVDKSLTSASTAEFVNITSSERTTGVQDTSKEPTPNIIEQSSASKNATPRDISSSVSEETNSPQDIVKPTLIASTRLTRRARFSPQVKIVGSNKTRAVVKSGTRSSSRKVVVNETSSRENSVAEHTTAKSGSDERISIPSNTASISGVNTGTKQPERRTTITQENGTDRVIPSETTVARKRTENIDSNVKRTEASETSGELRTLLEDVVVVQQSNEQVLGSEDSAPLQIASCLPVMMEDSSILHQTNITSQSLLGLEDENSQGPSRNTTAVVTDSGDLTRFLQLESADDLLQSLLKKASSDCVPLDSHRIDVDACCSTSEVHADPNKSVSVPLVSTENEQSVHMQTEDPLIERRLSPQAKASRNAATISPQNNEAASHSKIVVKRRRQKTKRQPQLMELNFDIRNVPIASNIEIEPEVCTDDIDHPVLELPVDLIQKSVPRTSPKSNKSSGELKQRFRQKRPGTFKTVLVRKQSESSDLEKSIKSGSTARGDSSTHQEALSKKVEDKTEEVSRRAKVTPNIHVKRKTSEPKEQTKSTVASEILTENSTELGNQKRNENGTISVDLFTNQGENLKEGTLYLSNDLKSRNNDTANSSGIEADLDTTVERTNILSSIEDTVEKEISIANDSILEVPDGCQPELEESEQGEKDTVRESSNLSPVQGECSVQSEIVVRLDTSVYNLSSGIQSETASTANENDTPSNVKYSATTTLPDPEQRQSIGTSVQDLSKDCQVEIVFEMTDTTQGCPDIVCESANAVSCSDECSAVEKPSRDKRITNESESGVPSEISNNVQRNLVFKKTNVVSSLLQNSDVISCESSSADTNTRDISADTNSVGFDPSTSINDISLNLSESAIEKAIRSSIEPLPDVIECPECPEMFSCLTTVDNASVNKLTPDLSQTQPGTLEDNVAREKRRASGEFEVEGLENDVVGDESRITSEKEANCEATKEKHSLGKRRKATLKQKDKAAIKRKRKVRGKLVDDDDESEDTEGNKRTYDGDDLGGRDGSLEDACVHDDTTHDNVALDGSLEGSTPEVPNDSSQDRLSQKSGSRKRQGKTIKPKIPAKRSRKKVAIDETGDTAHACDKNDQGTNQSSEINTNTKKLTAPQETQEASTSQRRKRGRSKSCSKATTKPSEQNETAETSRKKRKRRKPAAEKALDAVVNLNSMRICDMITYNPVTNPMASPNEVEERTPFLSGISSQNGQSETLLPESEGQPPAENAGEEQKTDVCAPRVTIDADGNIVLDEESMVIASTPVAENLDTEVVFENANQQYKSTQKKSNRDRWKKDETLYFYEVLSQIGTDFSLMAKLFPKRNRTELKKKFKREEKVNRDLVDKALNQRIPMAASLFADCLEETEEEMERSLVVDNVATETAAGEC